MQRDMEQVGLHAALTHRARLIEAESVTAISDASPSAIPHSLTWEGHEFLAASKDESTWKKGKAAVMSKAGTLRFELLRTEMRRQLGLL
jgi:Hypothetical protein (DUF2513)